VAGAAAAVLAWLVLVVAAIGFGRGAASSASAAGWAGTVLAGVAATLCLLAAFVLIGRLWSRGAPWRSTPGSHRR
jgi:protein-S-isoprenylcysteine O-methyltransferase Ste14